MRMLSIFRRTVEQSITRLAEYIDSFFKVHGSGVPLLPDEGEGYGEETTGLMGVQRAFSRYFSPREFTLGYGAQLLTHGNAIAPMPRLVLSDSLFRELYYYFSTSRLEFQLMGLVRQEAGNRFVMQEWVHNPHTAGVAHADMDQDAFPRWLDLLEQEGKDIRLLRVQVHSHGILEAYFSPMDVSTIRDAYSCNWMISIVGNQAGVILARLDVYEPVALSVSLPISIEYPQFIGNDTEKDAWDEKRLHANDLLTPSLREI